MICASSQQGGFRLHPLIQVATAVAAFSGLPWKSDDMLQAKAYG
jgi:hypothetical protein